MIPASVSAALLTTKGDGSASYSGAISSARLKSMAGSHPGGSVTVVEVDANAETTTRVTTFIVRLELCTGHTWIVPFGIVGR